MSGDIAIDKEVFHGHLSSLISQWKNDKRANDALFNGANSIVICVGKASEGAYPKSAALQLWLLGYEFPHTLFVITPDGITIVTTKKKAQYLESLKGGKIAVEVITRGKDADENAKQLEKCAEIVKNSGKKVGVLTKESPEGPFAEEWKKSLATISKEVEEVEIGPALASAAFAVKDERELILTRDASRTSARLLTKVFVEEMSKAIDEGASVKNSALADNLFKRIEDQKYLKGLKISETFDESQLDWAIQPTVQSGGNYDLKFAAEPDDQKLHDGVIVAALGVRYQSYASVLARTYMVNPNKEQESNYQLLEQIHNAVLATIRDGITPREVYSKALNILKEKKPDLEKHFPRSVGYGIGIEVKDNSLLLGSKNGRALKDGMTLVVQTSFTDVENKSAKDKKSKTYSLVIADTVRVAAAKAINFTREARYDSANNLFFFDDASEPEEKPRVKKDSRIGAVAQSNIVSKRLRADRAATDTAEKDAARREHQKGLHSRKQQEGLKKYAAETGALNGTEEKKFKRFQSYKREEDFPNKAKELIIVADPKNQSIILPILGRAVPFHINTIKNASTTAEGAFTSLRINFLSPGQGVGRKDDQPFEDPNAQFVRSLTFRSKDHDRMSSIAASITDMKKESVRREQEKKQLEDVVEQDKITIDRRPLKLDGVFMRPGLEGKRRTGELQIHMNGLKYVHGGMIGNGQDQVDVLFNNVRHLFFQPCKAELIVIIHVHLINPIMIGKRKTKDVQFYREATDMAFDETGNRKRKHRYGDEEEFEQEEQERKRRAALDKEFLGFARKIEEADKEGRVRVDAPVRELGFNGVPARSSVWVQPTTDCLVQLTEPPFLVVTLEDIEVVHLERVQFGLKNFDMVVIFKDFTRNPQHINTIPVDSLDAVKDWLDSVEIPFSEGPLNLQWPTIMKTVQSDPHAFFADGGWNFLSNESDSERDEDSEEAESAFEMSDSELAISDESSGDGSDFDEDASAEASEEDFSGDDTEGEDWDELEKKAIKADKNGVPEDGESRGKKSASAPKRKR